MGLSAFLSSQVLDATSVGRSVMTATDAAAARSAIGAGTSSFDGAFSSLSGTPATLSGYGITNAYTKTEVDNLVAGLLDFKGNQDCSTNPNYPSALKGDSYYVSVAGKIGGASGISVDVGDLIVCSADNAGGTQASVGSSWFVLEKNLNGALVSSNNLSDLTSASTARSNLGLGSLATVTPTGTPNGSKFLRDDFVWTTIDLSAYLTTSSAATTYVPYTGATGAVNLGTQSLSAGAITASGQFTNSRGTLTSSSPLTLTQTWNSGATTFTGALVNITDTASASASLLADLQVGGTTMFRVQKDGRTTIKGTLAIASGSSDVVRIGQFANDMYIDNVSTGGSIIFRTSSGNATLLTLTQSSGIAVFGVGVSTPVLTGSSNVLDVRNGTSAQTLRLFNTYTSSTNAEWHANRWSLNSATPEMRSGVAVGSAGGTARNWVLGAWDATDTWIPKVVITPTASGAFYLGPVADGTTTGGNARGAYAVDLCMARGIASYVASGSYSFAAGYGNLAQGSYSVAIGNFNNSGSGQSGVVLGDNNEMLSSSFALATGAWSQTNKQGQRSHASGSFNFNRGTAQICDLVLRNSTSNATATTLFLDGSSLRPTIQSGKGWDFTVKVFGMKMDGGKVAKFWRQGVIKNVGGTTTLVVLQTLGTDYEDDAGTDVAITADDTNDALQIQVTGIAGESWRWVAHIWYEELAYS